MMRIINNKEMRFVGLQRCGNHAIINWVLSQCRGKMLFLNFITPNSNPYMTAAQDRLPRFCKDFNLKKEQQRLSVKDYLLYSYEDNDLSDVFNIEFERQHDQYVGMSAKRYDVLVLRDVFNFFACRLKFLDGPYIGKIPLNSLENTAKLISLWKMYALEYMGRTNYLKYNKLVISYNKWFMDKDYRRMIADQLSLKFTDDGIDRIAVSSTFENKKDGDAGAQGLRVLERWKSFVNNSFYRSIFIDKELIELSDTIFGEIHGTEILF
jgi:hypothetical protein